MRLMLMFLVLLAGCSGERPPTATLPSGWSEGDPELVYDLTPHVDGMPNDAPSSVYLAPGEKIVARVLVVPEEITQERKGRWGLVHSDMRQAYAEELEDHRTHILGSEREETTLRTADGTSVAYHKVRIKPGVLAGKDVVWGLGLGSKDGKLLILSLGSLTEDYDGGEVEKLVSSLSW